MQPEQAYPMTEQQEHLCFPVVSWEDGRTGRAGRLWIVLAGWIQLALASILYHLSRPVGLVTTPLQERKHPMYSENI